MLDDAAGDLLQTFLNPNPALYAAVGLDFFGRAVAGNGITAGAVLCQISLSFPTVMTTFPLARPSAT
jgi:hypothetical protein